MRRGSKLLSVSVVALLLGVAPGGAARAAGPGAARTSAEVTDVGRTATLITGDRVTLLGDGVVSVHPGKGRDKIPMLTSTANGHVKVIPADALPLLRADRLDDRLFDVTGLLDAGYGDRRADLPLIVGGTAGASGTVVRRLASVKATAVRARKSDLGRQWPAMSRGAGKVWLDAVGRFTGAEGIQQIGAPIAWKAGLTGTGVTVAVVDSGVDITHPDLAGRVRAQTDFSPLGTGGTPTTEDVHDVAGHGTFVASVIAGSGSASAGRYRGVAPDVRLVSAKVGDFEVTQSTVIAAMEWAVGTEHAKIVNMSLGFADSAGADPLEGAVNDLTSRYGALFVVAAGNDGNNGNNGNNPNNADDYSILSPATAEAALSVGAVDHDNRLADFSSRGPGLDGDTIKPEITAPGVDITGALSADTWNNDGGLYATGYGTSYASPHVAGSAAILAEKHPDWSPALLKSALMGSARPAPGIGVFAQGAGRVDIPAALGSSVVADPPSLSLGTQTWPHTANTPITKTVTYRNTGRRSLTLGLRLEMSRPGGKPAAAGLFTLSATSLTVPAGGSAQALVRAGRSATAPAGPYSGKLTATAGYQVVRTPVGLIREAEFHNLTLHQIGRDGLAPEDYYTEVIGIDTPYVYDSLYHYSPEADFTLRVPKGRYAIVTRLVGEDDDGYTGTVLAQPSLSVGADTELTLDARTARPVQVTVPEAGAVRSFSAVDIGVRTLSGWTTQGIRLGGDTQPYTAQLGANGTKDGFVSSIRTAFSDGADPSAYAYQLGWAQPGTLPTGFSRQVTQDQLATETISARRQAPGSSAELSASTVIPGYSLTTVANGTPLAARNYFNVDGATRWVSEVHEWQDGVDYYYGEVHTVGRPRAYRAGHTYASVWNSPVIGPCLAPGWGVGWTGGELKVRVPMACDGAGHVGVVDPAVGATTLFRNGKAVATSDIAGHATFSVRPAGGRYRLHLDATRAAPFETSTRTTVDWKFTDPAVLPNLYTVRLSPVPAGAAATIAMVTAARATRVKLEVSYDDGAAWQPATVRRTGPGAYLGKVVHPDADGFVSLRVTATGGGSEVVQTIVRAYRIAR
jgi:subtilisin family serine protease